ncbi:nitrile hydratase subunit beta [Methylocystis sp.]|uniref:nitrile hydratase subunit beta n=1 Tax=Methylocystis sp. TaxID=1911079 RepID=UPI00345C18DD
MKLRHHIGGLEGLLEPLTLDRRVFAEEWERRIFGVHVAMMGLSGHLGSSVPAYAIADVPTTFRDMWTWAHLRARAEAMDPFDYFKFRYYEKWLNGIAAFPVDEGYLREDELASRTTELRGQAARPPGARLGVAGGTVAIDEQIMAYLRNGDSPRRDVAHPKFAVGQLVRIANLPAGAHTRLPGYLRGRSGTVAQVLEGDYAYF